MDVDDDSDEYDFGEVDQGFLDALDDVENSLTSAGTTQIHSLDISNKNSNNNNNTVHTKLNNNNHNASQQKANGHGHGHITPHPVGSAASSRRPQPTFTSATNRNAFILGGAAKPPPYLPSGHKLAPDPELARKLSKPPPPKNRWTATPSSSTEPNTVSNSNDEANELRRKLQELQTSLEQKAGEVVNLRRGLKKEQDDRNNDRITWDSEKQAIESRIRENSRLHTLELERLQTEYAFKRQELETSVRRAPNRITPSTQMPKRTTTRAGSSSPIKGPSQSTRKSARSTKEFKSFHNSFQDAPSQSLLSPRKNKNSKNNNSKITPENRRDVQYNESPANVGQHKRDAAMTNESDFFDGMDFDFPSDPLYGNDQPKEPLAPKIIFSLFAHNSCTTSGNYISTLNLLIDARHTEKHEILVRELFEWIGVAGSLTDVSLVMKLDDIMTGFMSLLLNSEEVLTLASLLLLISSLSLMFPIISYSILEHPMFDEARTENKGIKSGLLSQLGDIITEFDPSSHSRLLTLIPEKERDYLLCASLYLLQALTFEPTEACLLHLENFINQRNIIKILLHFEQSVCVVSSTMSWLYRLSTYPNLFRSILSSIGSTELSNSQSENRLPFIDRLSGMVIFKNDNKPSEVHELQMGALRVLSVLSIQHQDAISLLSHSTTLIANLISRVAMDVNLLLDSDNDYWFEGSEITTYMLLSRIKATVNLLRLLTKSEQSVNLRTQLDNCPAYVHHLFIASIGQLASSNPPFWLHGEELDIFGAASEYAKDLMALFLSPEEEDEIWDICQGVEHNLISEDSIVVNETYEDELDNEMNMF